MAFVLQVFSQALEKDEKFEEKNKVNSGHRFCSTLAR